MTKEEFLLDMLDYYTTDVSRRAIQKGVCVYKTTDGRKCAIGRHINDEKYDPLIEGCVITINGPVINCLNENIKSIDTVFLRNVQKLHDSELNWDKNKLSEYGKDQLHEIIIHNNLDKSKFTKYIN